MKRIFGFGRKRKGQRPRGSASPPRPSGAYDLRQKDLGKLHRAAACGDLAQVRQGLKKHGIDGRDKAERTPLHLACANGHVDVVTYLVENKCKLNVFDNDNRSPLMKAVQCQQEKCVAVLLEHGADPNLADADGNTALHLAVISSNISVAGLLLEHNANIDAQNKEGCSPLILAVSEHQEEIVEFLLTKGADVHARDQCERTPLMTAASGGELNLIQVLLRYGADVSHKDTKGRTAEDYAVIRGYSSLSKQLSQYTDWKNTGEASASDACSTRHRAGACDFTLGAPAMDRGGMPQSPNQASRMGKSRKAMDAISQGDSISSEEGSDDSWHTSEEEELDFTPSDEDLECGSSITPLSNAGDKLPKPNLTLLMNASQQYRKNNGDSSRIESLKSPKKCLRERTLSDANPSKGECGQSLIQDVSDAKSLEEEEEVEEEGEYHDKDNGEDDEDYEEEEEDEDLTQDEKEEEDLEDEETQSNDIVEEEQGEKKEPKWEMNQKLEYVSSAKYEEKAWCEAGNVCDNAVSKKLGEKVEESVDTPVSSIDGCYERLQENITAMSPKIMNNEVSCKSVPKQAVFQNLNNLQDTQESWNKKSMIQKKFHRNADSCFVDSEMTNRKKEIPQPLSGSCGLKEKKLSFGDGFENCDNSWLAAKNPRLESQRPNSVVLECVDDEDTDEEQCEEVGGKVCEALKQESENLCLNKREENLKAAFSSSTKEESSEWDDEEEEQEKQDVGEELQTAVVEGVPTVVEAEEDADSPWDSEIIETDSGSLRKASPGVLFLAADRHGACSKIASGEHNNGFSKKPSNFQLKTPEAVSEINKPPPKNWQQKSDLLEEFGLGDAENIEGEYSGSTSRMSSSAAKEDIKDTTENYEVQDKYILETTNLIENAARENQTDRAEISHHDEKAHSADKQLSQKTWEERYEKMWVENEKRELKTNFKNITAELKQLFGEISETGKTTSHVEEASEDGFSEELKSSPVVFSSRATESSSKLESKGDFGDTKLMLGGRVPKMEIVIPSLAVLPDKNNLNANVEDTWSADEEDGTNDTDNTKLPLATREEKKVPTMKMEERESGTNRNVEGCPECSLTHSLKTNTLDDISNALPKIRPISTSDENVLFATERKLGKVSGFNEDLPSSCLIDKNNKGETEIESPFANVQQSCGMLKRNLDEQLKQDMERFKSKIGMLQMVFLALEKEKAELQKEVEKEKSKERCLKMQVMTKQDDLDKLNTPLSNITDQQRKQKLTLRKNERLKMENESAIEEKDKKNFSSEKRLKLIKMPMSGKFALNAEVAKKNKRRTLKKAANQQLNSCSGNNFQVLDDSTSSETSQDEGRPAAKTGIEKNKVSIQMDITDDLDLTHLSDTTSEDVELPTSAYEEAMLLLEQLSVDPTGSSILLKIQNILLQYEQIIKHEKNRYRAVWREVRKLESEKEESKLIVEETQDLKSILAHQEVKWKSDIQSLKCTLKQEEEKMLRLETLCEKTREELRRKEDQYCKEMEEKQQLELHSKNLEMELITLRKLLRQVEEERDETQRQLSQEKSARALQEGILNNHLWRQKELEEETRRTIEKNSEESDTEREKDLLYKNQLLQDEIGMLRLELDQVRLRHQEEEGKYLEENEALKEKNEDLKKELKLNEEALTQTVFQYNGQLNLLKTESAVLCSKLEQTKESKDRLETEMESFRSRLNTAAQELERHQSSKCDVERSFQRERDEWLRLQDKLHHDLSDVRETNKSLSQQLSKAESKANSLENELHQLKQTLREKTLLLEMTQKELSQAQCQAKECDHARQLEKDQVSKFIIKQESMQERLVQLQSENLLLRQQLEDMQNKGIIKEKIVNDVQDRFNDIFNKLRADTEKQVCLVEERNKELNAKCTDLREQVFKYETEKVEREGVVRQLQQELADALKKQSMSEASLEVTTRYRCNLEEDKLHLQKELEKVNTKIRELEEQKLQSEHCVHDLKTVLDNKEREVVASSQKLQDLLLASSGTNATIKQLEEHVQRLEIENARLEAMVQQQSSRTEALQRDLQAFASVHNLLEDLLTSLRTTQAAAEDHHQQMQKQNVLGLTSDNLHSMWEEQLKSRSHLEERVAQLDREKSELLEQCENERKKVKKLVELKRPVELRLDQEMKRNIELQKDCKRLKRLMSRAMKKVRVYEEREMESQLNLQGEVKNRYSEMVNELGRLRTKVGDLSQQLENESKKGKQLEAQNRNLQGELSTMSENHEKLEKSRRQLKEEVANLKHQLEANMVARSQIEQYKRETEERAAQEIRQKLEEVNLFLQTQAVSQDRLEQIRASHHASLRNQLKHRIRDLECELDRIKNTQQDGIFQQESTHAEVERYKELYVEEVKIRRRLGNKLERANERLAEAHAKLLQERRRNRSLFTSSIVSGGLAESPVQYSTELGHLGNSLTLNRSLSLGGSFLSPTWNAFSSRNRVEAYVAKVRQELDEKITKELEWATAELETGSAGASPMISTDGSSKHVHVVDQDPLCRATQEYCDVLTKNCLI